MKIVILSDYDAAGNMYNLASGINTYTEHSAMAIKLKYHPTFYYPTTLLATKGNMGEVRKLIYDSDAVIFKEEPNIAAQYGLDTKKLRCKPIVFLVGGWGFRNPNILAKNRRRYNQKIYPKITWGTTSIDFLEKNPSWSWVPACIRLEELRKSYNWHKLTPPLIVASPSPSTNRMLKMQYHFERTMALLKTEKHKFRAEFIEDLDNDACLKIKAGAAIFFDRIYDIYGINSQEAAAFSAVVVTGSSAFTLDKLREFGFNCPFVIVKTNLDLKNSLSTLLADKKLRDKKALQCYEYVKQLHSGEESAKRLIKMLEA